LDAGIVPIKKVEQFARRARHAGSRMFYCVTTIEPVSFA
jgi:hypothetical protein